MKKLNLALALCATSLSLANAATMVTYVATDNQFFNTATVGAGGAGNTFVVDSTSGVGTASYTINYTFTGDLTSVGGTAAESISFSVTYSTPDGVIPSGSTIGVDGPSDSSNNVETGESIVASISFSPTGLYTNIEFGAIQSYGTADMEVGGVTKAGPNPVFGINATSFTITNVDPDTATDFGNIGFTQIRITAVPEPSSALLLGIASVGFLRRRR